MAVSAIPSSDELRVSSYLIGERLDDAGAERALQENLESTRERVRAMARLDLGKLAFDQGNQAAVLNYLEPLFESDDLPLLPEAQEFLGRLILGLAADRQGETDVVRRQLRPLALLAASRRSENAERLVDVLRRRTFSQHQPAPS